MSAAIAAFSVALIYSYSHQYLWTTGFVPVVPGLWYLLVLCLGMFSMLLPPDKKAADASAHYDYGRHVSNKIRFSIWAVAYLGISYFSFSHSIHSEIDIRSMKTAVITAIMFIVYLIILKDASTIRAARIAIIGVVVFSIMTNVIDITSPGLKAFSETPGRAAGFYVNPNISGAYLVMGMLLSITLLSKRFRGLYCMLVGMGVLITFSRASMLMWLVSATVLARMQLFRMRRAVATGLMVAVVVVFASMQLAGSFVEELGLDRILTKDQLSRIQFNEEKDLSVQGRLYVIQRSLDLIAESPIIGYGLGSSNDPVTEVHPHNMFLFVWVEQGVLGLAVYLSLFYLLWKSRCEMSRLFAVALAIAAVTSHNIMDDSAFYVAVAVLAGMTHAVGSKAEKEVARDAERLAIRRRKKPLPRKIDPGPAP